MKSGSKVHCLYEVEIFRRGRLVVRITQFLVEPPSLWFLRYFSGAPAEIFEEGGKIKKKGQRKEVELVEQKMYLV